MTNIIADSSLITGVVFVTTTIALTYFVVSYCSIKAEKENLSMKLMTLDALYKDDIANKCLDIAHLRAQIKEKEQIVVEPGGLLVFKAKRAQGAPPLRLYDIKEAIVIADTRANAIKILTEQDGIINDGWWTLVDIIKPEVIIKEVIP